MNISKTVFFYAIHLLAGTVGAILPVFLGLVGALLLMSLSLNLQALIGPLLGLLVGEPFFPSQILLGLFLGWYLNGRLGHGFARWVWILPAIRLAYTIATWDLHLYSTVSYWEDIRQELFFLAGRSSTEGIYQRWVTLPFYTSIAYSIGAYFGYRRWLRRNAPQEASQDAGPMIAS